ncbi:MAG: protein CysJ, partial [Pseudomonadota bacterium]
QALNDIIQQQGGFSDDRTADYVAKLKREKRYVRDVY